jgi:hypothetical protein
VRQHARGASVPRTQATMTIRESKATWKTSVLGALLTCSAGLSIESAITANAVDDSTGNLLWFLFLILFFVQGVFLVLGMQTIRFILRGGEKVQAADHAARTWARMMLWFVCTAGLLAVVSLARAFNEVMDEQAIPTPAEVAPGDAQ